MNTSDESRPIVLDYLGEYRIFKRVLFWKSKPQYLQRVDLLIRIEDELMNNLEELDILGLNYCVPWVDIDGQYDINSDEEPRQFYHSDRHKSNSHY